MAFSASREILYGALPTFPEVPETRLFLGAEAAVLSESVGKKAQMFIVGSE